MDRISQKIALITGASRGLGAETAKLFAQEGAHIILTDIKDDEGKALAQSLGAVYYHLDVSREQEWRAVCQAIETTYGYLDILVNNAGITGFEDAAGLQDPEHATLDDWHHVHHVNLDGVFLGCKYGIRLMKKQGGSIVNLSSRSGMVGIPAAAAYASSKAAIRNHTKTVALYCAQNKYNIRCNSLHPGAVLTPMWDAMLGTDAKIRQQAIAHLSKDIPLGHMGAPIDVAYAALYLGSDESRYITGAELTIDGGILAGSMASPHAVEETTS